MKPLDPVHLSKRSNDGDLLEFGCVLVDHSAELPILSPATAVALVNELDSLPPAYWCHYTDLESGRYLESKVASYRKASMLSLPSQLKDRLMRLAPRVPGFQVNEAVVNQYSAGDFIPLHVDRDRYMYNLIIPLTSSEVDGVTIDNVKYTDTAGVGHMLVGMGLPHKVDPVKDKRYTLMYLYH